MSNKCGSRLFLESLENCKQLCYKHANSSINKATHYKQDNPVRTWAESATGL
jgi:hypothetical protein